MEPNKQITGAGFPLGKPRQPSLPIVAKGSPARLSDMEHEMWVKGSRHSEESKKKMSREADIPTGNG